MPPMEGDNVEEEKQDSEKLDGGNIIFHCTLHEDRERLAKIFDDIEDPYHEDAATLLNEKNEISKSPLELACMLGRVDILRELVKRGTDINEVYSSGYTAMHFAACWGQRTCLEVLVELGAKVDCRTKYGESPKQLALRYNHKECVDFIDWAVAKLTLTAFITHVRELVSDPEKLQGVKLTKEEKSTALTSCNERQEWLESTEDATLEDFMMKKADLEKQVEMILNKANSPAPASGGSGKK